MTRRIRTLGLSGRPGDLGRAHGSAHADEIRAYAEDRISRSADGTDLGRSDVLEIAERMLPAHAAYDADLFEEMEALAVAAGITPAAAVIVGGYTDFIDTVRAVAGAGPAEDNCTAVIVPDGRAGGAGFLAQTWDMHASATPHVVMLELAPTDRPAALVFSTVGCLGQIGLSAAGIAVGINNLTAADGKIGVTWPFVVRAALAAGDIDEALDRIRTADLAGGHNYLLFDHHGRGFDVEAMPTAVNVTRLDDEPIIHTNHCVSPDTRTVEGARHEVLQTSSLSRMAQARDLLGTAPVDVATLMKLTMDERSICRRPEPPFDYETCGAAIMRPRTGDFWACWGRPSEHPYELFTLTPEGAR